MIIVTGTKRSGTSMWMQIMKAAGLKVIGEAFPKNWEKTIRDANERGFYESPLRRGIYYRTNPHPQSGAFLAPGPSKHLAVKVFIPGLVRSDMAYIHRVVGTMRHWREYATSLERLYAMERENLTKLQGRERPERRKMPPVLEWWLENYMLVRDIVTRRYPAHLVSYDRVTSDPSHTIPRIIQWIGVGDAEAAKDAVAPEARTQRREELAVEHRFADVFDELYRLVHEEEPLTAEFIATLNETHEGLLEEIEAARREVALEARARRAAQRRRQAKRAASPELDADMLDMIVHGDDAGDGFEPDQESAADGMADDREGSADD